MAVRKRGGVVVPFCRSSGDDKTAIFPQTLVELTLKNDKNIEATLQIVYIRNIYVDV